MYTHGIHNLGTWTLVRIAHTWADLSNQLYTDEINRDWYFVMWLCGWVSKIYTAFCKVYVRTKQLMHLSKRWPIFIVHCLISHDIVYNFILLNTLKLFFTLYSHGTTTR